MRKPVLAARSRMAPMPVLPVFHKLQGRQVLLAGGDEDALWKAELIQAAGAHLRLCADAFCPDFDSFLTTAENIDVRRRRWKSEDFDGVALAIGGFAEKVDAQEFAAAARLAGVPVNTIDHPDTCDFQFGSIINRAPVVVSISTNGAAPILGQAVRQRIETLLPASIATWAAAGARIRKTLSSVLPSASDRRSFWRWFADAAFTTDPEEIDTKTSEFLSRRVQKSGQVTLVGAGPGAEDLLTLRAVRALQAADVILFDDLVSDEVLDFARREAKRITVGKRGGRNSCSQNDINELMIRLAKQGKRVVRLKSGDPMVFGRGGEEIQFLEAAGIAVDVVPGITASVAAAARLKTSLTHRDCAQGVKFVTGHARDGQLPELDWRACADPHTTLMIYMGARTARALARRLLEEGMEPETPVVVMKSVSRPDEEIATLTLSQLQNNHIERSSPVLIGVGMAFSDVARRNLEKTTGYDIRLAANSAGF